MKLQNRAKSFFGNAFSRSFYGKITPVATVTTTSKARTKRTKAKKEASILSNGKVTTPRLKTVSERANKLNTNGKHGASVLSKGKITTPKVKTDKNGAQVASEKRRRGHYSEEDKRLVREKYPKCKNREEKIELARMIGIESPEKNLHKLYNLASREKATRSQVDYENIDYQDLVGNNGEVTIEEEEVDESYNELKKREDPATTKFSRQDDAYIKRHFGSMSISDIAKQRDHTETATMYRARHLRREDINQNLRRPCVGYYLHKVAAWLGMDEKGILLLRRSNVEVRPLPDPEGKVERYWVHTVSLAAFLKKYDKKLIKENDADEFFIMDVLESAADLAASKIVSEDCYFLEHSHVCINPQAAGNVSCSLFCDGNDRHCTVKDDRP